MTDQKPPDAAIVVEHDDITYRMTLNQFTARDEREIWKATGVPSIPRLLSMSAPPPVWAIAALLWRWRVTHCDEPDLTYRQVEDALDYASVDVDLNGEATVPEA